MQASSPGYLICLQFIEHIFTERMRDISLALLNSKLERSPVHRSHAEVAFSITEKLTSRQYAVGSVGIQDTTGNVHRKWECTNFVLKRPEQYRSYRRDGCFALVVALI